MAQLGISKLERVPLREVWKHEAHNFTQWLKDNVEILSEALVFCSHRMIPKMA